MISPFPLNTTPLTKCSTPLQADRRSCQESGELYNETLTPLLCKCGCGFVLRHSHRHLICANGRNMILCEKWKQSKTTQLITSSTIKLGRISCNIIVLAIPFFSNPKITTCAICSICLPQHSLMVALSWIDVLCLFSNKKIYLAPRVLTLKCKRDKHIIDVYLHCAYLSLSAWPH